MKRTSPIRVEHVATATALAVPWLFIWQGLDFTDQGYLLTSYRCFFRHPETTEDGAATWLTNLLGAIWDAIFGGLGVLGMRALWALCMSLGMLLAFRLARSLTSERAAAFATLAASVFLSDRRETWFSYNTSTSLVLAAIAVCLLHAIRRRHNGWLFAAGALMGLAPFARFPNLLVVGFVVALGVAALLDAERRSQLPRDVAVVVLGVVVGVAGMLAVICGLGHWPPFIAGMRGLFAPSVQQAGYSFHDLLRTFVSDEAQALAWGFGVCAAAAAAARILAKLPPALGWVFLAACAVAGVFGLTQFDEPWRYVVPGTVYWVLAGVALGIWRRSFDLRVASTIVLMVVVIAPLGSGNGIKNAHVGLWLAVPLLLALLHTLDPRWLAGQGSKVALLAGLTLVGEGLHRADSYTYRDSARTTLVTPVAFPQLRGQYTSAARAKVVTEVLTALQGRVAPGDYLLAYEGTPLLQYLTSTRPYLNRAWLMGVESGEVIAELAADAPRRTGCLPIAVRTLKSTRGPDWPRHSRRLEEKQPQRGVRRALKAFLSAQGYKRTWSNGFFEILEPPLAASRPCR